jgi:hypothetical protein
MASEMICPLRGIWLILCQIPLGTLFDWTFLLENMEERYILRTIVIFDFAQRNFNGLFRDYKTLLYTLV